MASPAETAPAPGLRYLSAADVDRCLPDGATRLDLAEQALRALGRGAAEMPPKLGVHPRSGALLHAMPAWLRDGDLVGLKWVAAFPGNRAAGLPAINGLVVLNDPNTGLPTWIMDAARITAVRTAAVSGVAIRLFQPREVERVAILGAGIQARSHLEVVGALLPGVPLAIYDRHPERAEALVSEARAAGLSAEPSWDAREASAGSSVVVTVATLGSSTQTMTRDWVQHETLVVAVDFATYVSAELAQSAARFVVDDREQFLAYRDGGYFDGYPEPSATLGEILDDKVDAAGRQTVDPSPAAESTGSPTVVSHLGVGLADVILADAIARRALELGVGMALPR